MFIAHLPAGYLLSRLHPALRHRSAWVMAGAVLPDVDMLYFIFVDAGMTHHHSYLTHRPAMWALVLLLCLSLSRCALAPPLTALSLGALLHMALDSVAGAIDWGWPLWRWDGPLVIIPASYDWWVMSFLSHWTFGIEGLICLSAGLWLWRERVRDARTLRKTP